MAVVHAAVSGVEKLDKVLMNQPLCRRPLIEEGFGIGHEGRNDLYRCVLPVAAAHPGEKDTRLVSAAQPALKGELPVEHATDPVAANPF